MAASVPVRIPNRLTADKALEVPADNILVTAIPFLAWNVQPPPPPPGGIVAPLPPRTLPQWAAFDAFFSPCSFDSANNPAQWATIHCLIFALLEHAWSRILSALVDAGLGSQPISEEGLDDAVLAAALLIPAPPAGQPHPLMITPADLDGLTHPFDFPFIPAIPGQNAIPAVPARRAGPNQGARRGVPFVPAVAMIPAVPPVPGPAPLAYLPLTPVVELCDPSLAPSPSRALAFTLGLLGPVFTRQVRLDVLSAVSLVAETLATGIRSSRANASNARVATALPGYIKELLSAFPRCFHVRIYRNPAAKLDDLDTRINYVYGSSSDRFRIEVARVHRLVYVAPTVGALLVMSASVTDQHAVLRRLLAELMPTRSRDLLALVWSDLEAALLARNATLTDCINRSADISDAATMFITAVRSLAAASSGTSSSAGRAADASGSTDSLVDPALRDLNALAMSAAVNEGSFADAWRDVRLLDQSKLSDQLETLSLCFESGSMILHRYLSFGESKLESKHELFQTLKGLLFLRGKYFGRALTIRPNNTVPKLAENYGWDATEELARDAGRQTSGRLGKSVRFSSRSEMEVFLAGDFPAMDLVNAPAGYMGIEALLDHNTAEWLDVRHHYCTKSSLEGIQVHLKVLTISYGYAATSRRGYTAETWVQQYINFAGKGQSLTGERRVEWNRLADTSFRADLRYWKHLHMGKLTHPAPAGQRLDYILPFETEGVAALTQRLDTVSEVATLQMAMGITPTDQQPLRVDGVFGASPQHQPRPGTPPPQRGRDSSRDGLQSRSASRSRSVSPAASDASHGSRVSDIGGITLPSGPGSRSSVVGWSQNRHTFTIGRPGAKKVLFEAKQMADHCGVPLDSKCWPSLISVKAGDARYALCTEWGKPGHESPTSSAHVDPSGWDAAVMRARFSRDLKPQPVRHPGRSGSSSSAKRSRGSGSRPPGDQ